MKHALLLGIAPLASLLLAGRPAQARALSSPIDTVVGQAHFTHVLSAGMCARLAQESQKTDFSKLAGGEGEALLKRLMLGAMGDNFTEFSALMEKAGQANAAALGKAVGMQAVVEMVQHCPNAGALLARIGGNRMGSGVEMSTTERGVLLPIAQAACQRLDAENAKKPFAQLTPAQRSAQVQQVLSGTLLSNAQALTEQYGEEVMESEGQGEEIGKKVGLLLLEVCPTYIMEVGRDAMTQRLKAEAGPAPAPAKAPPPRKTSAKTTPLKSGSKR